MPGFLSDYSKIVTVYLDADQKWWAKVRRNLTRGDFKSAQDILITATMRYSGGDDDTSDAKAETSGPVNTGGYQNELVARALVEWNLTDENDNPIPIGSLDAQRRPDPTRYAAIDAIPQEAFDLLLAAIEGATNKKKVPAATANDKFRSTGAEGAATEGTGAGGVGAVPGGAEVLV